MREPEPENRKLGGRAREPDQAARPETPDPGPELLDAAVRSARLALRDIAEAMNDATGSVGGGPLLRGAVKGYESFFTHMGEMARDVAREFQSESGRLVAKRTSRTQSHEVPPTSTDPADLNHTG